MKLFKTAIAGALMAGALTAQAAIVDVWGYTVSTIFTAAGPTGVSMSADQKTLRWGVSTGFGRSSLVISADPEGTVSTYAGGAVPLGDPAYVANGNTLTHNNNPINSNASNPSLQSATLKTTLNLFASGVSGGDVGESPIGVPAPISLDIRFWETPNSGSLAACPISGANGGTTVCDDIFALVTPLQNQSFVYEGETYFVNVFPKVSSLGLLPTSVCNTMTGQDVCYGFNTAERASTPLQFGFTISTAPLGVPEPGVLALVALAMVGAGYSLRKKKV